MHRILIVEDDVDLAEITAIYLHHDGYGYDKAGSVAEARRFLGKNEYDLVLLDELLPDGEGKSLCGLIREKCGCPIIFMSCLDDSGSIISALNSGGDDYVVKPVTYDVLLARVEANIRRRAFYRERECLEKGTEKQRVFRRFTIDFSSRAVTQNGREVELSSTEYALLLYLSSHPDTLLLYNELYSNVWNNESLGDVRTVMVHISNLRKKLDPCRVGLIRTVRGAGYVFTDV